MNLIKAITLIILAVITSHAETLRGKVTRVHDGDTFTLLANQVEYQIRLNGVDAPELAQPYGKESRDHLRDLLKCKDVAVIFTKQDWRKRIIGTVLCGSVNVNLVMIDQGQAWYFEEYAKDIPEIERHQYAKAEASARADQRGLWSERNPTPPWEWRRTRN